MGLHVPFDLLPPQLHDLCTNSNGYWPHTTFIPEEELDPPNRTCNPIGGLDVFTGLETGTEGQRRAVYFSAGCLEWLISLRFIRPTSTGQPATLTIETFEAVDEPPEPRDGT
ncbi:hypothetical protein JCM8547_005733 [Rhodosporidiobolus lusitaniae]